MRRAFWLAAPTLMLGAAVALAGSPGNDLVVHEWGTFLAVQGSDGVTVDGMYHEEHALPEFVHARSRDQLYLPSALIKGETPVIYFYTQQPRQVNVRVDFPSGTWTQWYPQASLVGPRLEGPGSPGETRNGHISWFAQVHPALPPSARVPETSAGALWNHSREVDAAWVSTSAGNGSSKAREYERFLFYRGLGQAPLPLEFSAQDGGTVRSRGQFGAAHLFVLRVEKGKAAYRYLPRLEPGQSLAGVIPEMKDALPPAQFTSRVGDELADRLAETGLYPKEARAMVNTWRSSYLKTEGIRVLCVLPQAWTDRFIPLKLNPAPRELVRVMVGRLELLTPERERQAEEAVLKLASPASADREQAFQFLRDQGRYAEPVLRRVLRTATDAKVQALSRKLLLTDFVTELRAAVHDAATGERKAKPQDVWYVRAQLASLLRHSGLEREAAEEGQRVLTYLRGTRMPAMHESIARHPLRAYARATEGIGDDAGAAEWYGKFIRFGSQVKTRQDCVGCHRAAPTEAPTSMAFYRDWWAGQRYAEAVRRAGRTRAAIREAEAALKQRPDDAASQLALAYLHGESGNRTRAAQLWAQLDPPAGRTVAGR